MIRMHETTKLARSLEERIRQYEICQARGHVTGNMMTLTYSGPTISVCRYCGTRFWTETIEHEEGAPHASTDPASPC